MSAFADLLKQAKLHDMLRQDKIIIHGDVKTAQLLVDILQQLDFDFEEVMSQWTGDIIAHQVSSGNKSGRVESVCPNLIKIGPSSSSAKRMHSPLVRFFLGI
jgi:ubiquinone biosynthesis protein UbiJ